MNKTDQNPHPWGNFLIVSIFLFGLSSGNCVIGNGRGWAFGQFPCTPLIHTALHLWGFASTRFASHAVKVCLPNIPEPTSTPASSWTSRPCSLWHQLPLCKWKAGRAGGKVGRPRPKGYDMRGALSALPALRRPPSVPPQKQHKVTTSHPDESWWWCEGSLSAGPPKNWPTSGLSYLDANRSFLNLLA